MFKWDKNPFPVLQNLKTSMQAKIIRIAINKGASVVRETLKSSAPSRFGYLRRAFRIKVKNYRNRTLWLAIIGSGRRVEFSKKGKKYVPSRYSHLVDAGTKFATGKHFMKPALDRSNYRQAMFAKIQEQIDQVLKG